MGTMSEGQLHPDITSDVETVGVGILSLVTLNALQQIDHVLEVGMADDIDYHIPLDVDLIQSLVRIVQEHAMHLSNESRELPPSSTSQPQVDAVATYAEAAA